MPHPPFISMIYRGCRFLFWSDQFATHSSFDWIYANTFAISAKFYLFAYRNCFIVLSLVFLLL